MKGGVRSKVLSLSFLLFFLFSADAILSFWAPNLVQDLFGSSAAMGFIISFSSVIGFGMDFIFPQLLKRATVRELIAWSVLGVILFALLLWLGLKFPQVAIFLVAMGVWGIYYEFFGFASHQFIADTVPFKFHTSSWAFLGMFKNLAYFIGPMLGGWLILRGKGFPAWGAILFALIGGVFLILARKTQNRPIGVDLAEVNLIKEFEHWRVLARYVWPMVVLCLFMGLIDSVFWTTGAIWTQELAKQSFWGAFFIPAYQLPSLFMGFAFAKWGIYSGKKKMAEKFLLLAGLFLAGIGLVKVIPLQVLLVFASSTMLAVSYPLADAVYSDIVARMGRQRNHLIGLSSSTINVAYIIGPISAGLVTSAVGEKATFSLMGVVVCVVSIILLIYTPRKLHLPRTEIQSWEK